MPCSAYCQVRLLRSSSGARLVLTGLSCTSPLHFIGPRGEKSGLFITAYHTGGRLGELRAIRWGQVDWAAHQIRLEARQTKGKAARVLPIYGEMQEVLAEALRHRNEWFPQCSLVFHRLGRPIGDFRKAWATACASAGVAITFHDLRRTAVRNMDRAGIPRDVAMRIIGHRTASMYSRYNIISERDLARQGGWRNSIWRKRESGRQAGRRRGFSDT